MFKSLLDYTNQLEDSIDVTKEFVRKLRGGVTRLDNGIAKAQEQVKELKNERTYASQVKEGLRAGAIKLAKDTLFDATVNAIKKRQEFDLPIYRNSIFDAIENSNTYLYKSTGAGFSSKLSVDINLDKTAGRLEMWATAVKRTRKQLGVKIPSKKSRKLKRQLSADRASRAWAGIYNTRGANDTYLSTIEMRMSNAAKKGAWWQLLDKGAVSMPSDRGGYATPNNKPLNFVHGAETQVTETLTNAFAHEKEKYLEIMGGFNNALGEAKDASNELAVLVQEISLDSKVIGTLNRKAERIFRANYITKLEKAVQLVTEGLIKTKKLQLAVKGSYRGKRFSVGEVKGLLY